MCPPLSPCHPSHFSPACCLLTHVQCCYLERHNNTCHVWCFVEEHSSHCSLPANLPLPTPSLCHLTTRHRYAGAYEHVFESTTAGVTIQAPQLDINTVAAGGGSRLVYRCVHVCVHVHVCLCVLAIAAYSQPGCGLSHRLATCQKQGEGAIAD